MKKKYCDLNVIEAPSLATNVENVKQLIKLGYHAIAITRIMDPPTKVNKSTPKPTDEEIHSFANSIKKLKSALEELKSSPDVDFEIPNDFQLFSRLTVNLENPDQGRLLRNFPYKSMLDDVDIIGICPQNEVVLKSVIENKVDCDIIALQLQNELPFRITRETIKQITDKHMSFEISYCHAIRSASLRRYVFKNGINIVKRTKRAEGIILSSHGEHRLDFRAPLDVVNLAHLFTVQDNVCFDVVCKNSLDALDHAKLRKHTYMGAVAVERIEPDEMMMQVGVEEEGDEHMCERGERKRKVDELVSVEQKKKMRIDRIGN